MPPNYHLESFWEHRFQRESHFEWLGDGATTILPHIRTYLHAQSAHSRPPRLLHIGAGTSSLSHLIRDTYRQEYGDGSGSAIIVNTDFSETAVRRGNEVSVEDRWETWVKVDALKWDEVRVLVKDKEVCEREEDNAERSDSLFAVVVDKSTSDAISCGEDVSAVLEKGQTSVHPDIKTYLKDSSKEAAKLPPVDVLALHLASIVRPGGMWIVLSYSAWRFPFLQSTGRSAAIDPLRISRFWSLEQLEDVDAPSGQDNPSVFAPPMKHYVYVLRRTSIEPDV